MSIKEKDSLYIANTYARFDVEIVSGKGSYLYDDKGKEYIDMCTGIAVNTLGVADEGWIAAVSAQLGKVQHVSNLYYSAPQAELAELLCRRTGMKKVFFGNSGAEANECAIKVARKYAAEKKGAEYNTIITLVNSFHGRTITTLAATGQDVFHKDFLPLTEGFKYAVANDIESVRALVAEGGIAAVMVEPVQGEGGVMPLTREFCEELNALAEEHDILIIADEVQTGNGRTGELYGYMALGLRPDVVSTAKGLAGGLPMGACMMNEKTAGVLTAGSHGSTFGGNPVSAAGALYVMSRLTDELLDEVKEKSDYVFSALKGKSGIKSVSGMGLMIGIETERDAGEVIAKCIENGVIPLKAKNKVRLLPALNIPREALEKAVAVIIEAARI
ncbi:MAG: acetylornithine/succinylornithine family transaminase [Clostridia bacterium]|nr:acetylornithine/succinylornithine family transaminase [Clostridia bacterium]